MHRTEKSTDKKYQYVEKELEFRKLSSKNEKVTGHFRFVDLPKPSNKKEYDSATKFFVEQVSGLTDVDSIYQIGDVSVQGMSDLDFVVVLKDDMKDTKSVISAIESSLNKRPYLIMHHPLMVTRKNFKELNYLFPAFSIKRLYGNRFSFSKIKNKSMWSAVVLNDYITYHWPREFMRYFLEKKVQFSNRKVGYMFNELTKLFCLDFGKMEIPARNALSRLNSMEYPLHLLEQMTGRKYPLWGAHISRIKKLRKGWFTLQEEKYDSLLGLLRDNIEFVYFLIDEANNFFVSKNLINCNLKNGSFMEKEFSGLFISGWSRKKSLEGSIRIYKRVKERTSILPLVFFYQRLYLDNILNEQMEENKRIHAKKEYEQILKKRFSLYKEEIDFLNRNKFPFKPIIKYDYLTTKPMLYKLYLGISRLIRRIKLSLAARDFL